MLICASFLFFSLSFFLSFFHYFFPFLRSDKKMTRKVRRSVKKYHQWLVERRGESRAFGWGKFDKDLSEGRLTKFHVALSLRKQIERSSIGDRFIKALGARKPLSVAEFLAIPRSIQDNSLDRTKEERFWDSFVRKNAPFTSFSPFTGHF